VDVEHADILGGRIGRAEGRPKKCQPLSMVTLRMAAMWLSTLKGKKVHIVAGVRVKYRDGSLVD
jgi:hypothetical protein